MHLKHILCQIESDCANFRHDCYPARIFAGPLGHIGARGVGVSKDTFLRGTASGVQITGHELRVIGINDWAWRKG